MNRKKVAFFILFCSYSFGTIRAQITGICDGINAFNLGGYDCNTLNWVSVFSDEFDGSSLDLSKWKPIEGVPRDFYTAPAWYKIENAIVSNGELRLRAKHETETHEFVVDWSTTPPTTITRTFDFTSAELETRYKFGEARYEIKCRIPDGNGGFWPAFWVYGDNGSNSISNEIDVFEYWDNDWQDWNMTAHKNGGMCLAHKNTPSFATNDKTYVLQWDRHNMLWWRNDEGTVRNFPRWTNMLGQPLTCDIPSGQKILNTHYPSVPPIAGTVLVSLGLQPGETETTSVFPADLVVDYIRIYRRVPCLGNSTYSTITPLLTTNGEYNFVTAVNLTLNGSFTIDSSIQLEAVASSAISLSPGFEAVAGSEFIARIGASNCGVPSGIQEQASVDELPSSLGMYEPGLNETTLGGTENEMSGMPVAVFPNPAAGSVFMPCSGEQALYELIDVQGRVLKRVEVRACTSPVKMDLGGVEAGIYLIRVSGLDQRTLRSYPLKVEN